MMGTLFDYIDWRGDLLFSQCEFNEADNLILSMLCYLDLFRAAPSSTSAKGTTLAAAIKKYVCIHREDAANIGFIIPPEILTLALKASKSERFGTMRVTGHVNAVSDNKQTQFSATTFLIGEDACFVAFRGTDDTIAGWKENLNMSFMSPVPSQLSATRYLSKIASAHPSRRIYIGGHSKGGNLAVWAAVKCSDRIKERIVSVWSNDGPGFDRSFIESESYMKVRNRIHTLLPQSSVVGMLLEHEENYDVVKSTQTGLLQHNGLSWEIVGSSFVRMNELTKESKRIDRTLKNWLNGMSVEEKRRTVDAVYEILSSTNAKTLTELSTEKLKLLKAWGNLDSDSKKFIKRLVSLMVKSTRTDSQKSPKQRAEKQD